MDSRVQLCTKGNQVCGLNVQSQVTYEIFSVSSGVRNKSCMGAAARVEVAQPVGLELSRKSKGAWQLPEPALTWRVKLAGGASEAI